MGKTPRDRHSNEDRIHRRLDRPFQPYKSSGNQLAPGLLRWVNKNGLKRPRAQGRVSHRHQREIGLIEKIERAAKHVN